EPVDPSREASADDLRDENEQRERHRPSSLQKRDHQASIIRPGRGWNEPRAWCSNAGQMPDDSVSPLREPPVRGVESRNGALVLHLAGEIDLYNAKQGAQARNQVLDRD